MLIADDEKKPQVGIYKKKQRKKKAPSKQLITTYCESKPVS